MDTPERLSAAEVARQASLLADDPAQRTVLETLPGPAMLLNDRWQIVAANSRLAVLVGEPADLLTGRRPGEAFRCSEAEHAPDGCGSAPACRVCGAGRCLRALEDGSGGPLHAECRITSRGLAGEGDVARDLEAGLSRLPGTPWTLVAMRDLGAEKRRRVLERIFFHDVLNSAGAVAALADLALDGDRAILGDLRGIAIQLIDEIRQQQALASAESGELAVRLQPLRLDRACAEVAAAYRLQQVAAGRGIDLAVPPLLVSSDAVLLGRVLGNLLRNALEAIPQGARVLVTATAAGAWVRLGVDNPGELTPEVRRQLFKRSFTTKRQGHGLGTWSVKLFTEGYLAGRVGYGSAAGTTTFWIELPAA